MGSDLRDRHLRKLLWSGGALLALLAVVGLLRLGGGLAPGGAPPATAASAAQPLPADYSPPATQPSVRQVSVLGVWARMAAVMIAAYGLLLGVRWWTTRRERGESLVALTAAPAQRRMQVRESLRLGLGWDLHLLQVGGHLLVVGSNATQMTLLGQIPAEPTAPPAPPEPEPPWSEPEPETSVRLPAQPAGLREREWEQRRADLIEALRRQVVE